MPALLAQIRPYVSGRAQQLSPFAFGHRIAPREQLRIPDDTVTSDEPDEVIIDHPRVPPARNAVAFLGEQVLVNDLYDLPERPCDRSEQPLERHDLFGIEPACTAES